MVCIDLIPPCNTPRTMDVCVDDGLTSSELRRLKDAAESMTMLSCALHVARDKYEEILGMDYRIIRDQEHIDEFIQCVSRNFTGEINDSDDCQSL